MYKVIEEYIGLRVCIPGEVIDLVPGVSQKSLRKIATMGLPYVEMVDEKQEKKQEKQE